MELVKWMAKKRVHQRVIDGIPVEEALSSLDVLFSLAYSGPKFKGYQRQGATQQLRTVEGALMAAISKATGLASVPLTALSRTDADVSARHQLVRLRLPLDALLEHRLGTQELVDEVNAFLQPLGGLVTRARFARPSQFQVRDAVRCKVYSYYIGVGRPHASVAHMNPYLVYVPAPLDLAAMATALAAAVGTHDFCAFTNAGRRDIAAKGGDGRRKRHESAAGSSSPANNVAGIPDTSAFPGESENDNDSASDDVDCEQAETPVSTSSLSVPGATLTSGGSSGSAGNTVRTMYSACVSVLRPEEVHCDIGRPQEGGVIVPPSVTESDDGNPAKRRRLDGDGKDGLLKGPEPTNASAVVVRFTFVGDGFLRHQLRRMAGALMAVGRGDIPPSFIRDALASGLPCGGLSERAPGGAPLTPAVASRLRGGDTPYQTAPGRGLWLERLVLIDEPLPLVHGLQQGGARLEGAGSGEPAPSGPGPAGTRLWEDDDWCNNPTPGLAHEWGLTLVKPVP